jgi:hypothetical protein
MLKSFIEIESDLCHDSPGNNRSNLADILHTELIIQAQYHATAHEKLPRHASLSSLLPCVLSV